ncbi:MAG: ornithine carbamoyltransferase [Xanthomonadales bacterium]|jgi:ornithine carbamoyltransferase|nr:ornithine carbamoyltransferase [Xanthomonadales bacterium]MDH3923007.1 ornithine carbamoyltransferase [Xanthomonadales bacterium]MDH3942058.1 ornithine carbamoyltransferase [Xanthomonadales bacterium]MDH4001126.1 ornithine carbamoyltransferase [Xanthomonadales bacterium]
MSFNLRNRSFLKLIDFSKRDLTYILDLARDLKRAKYTGNEIQLLRGKNIALIFEKASTRTRCAFEVAAYDQGANVTYLDPTGSHMGSKESVKDTARVLGRMYDAIEYRGFSQQVVEELAEYSGVPVFNGLTDEFHPTQMCADLMTMREFMPQPWHDFCYAYVGDARSNMGNSLMIAGCLMGMDVRIAAPRNLWPDEELLGYARELEQQNMGKLTLTEDPAEAVKGVQFIHTDVWVSMGEPPETWKERIELLKPYQVNAQLMAASGNPRVRFMHCLPAFHNLETQVGRDIHEKFGIDAMEVTEEVFESTAGIQFEQAENRVHSIKALLVATLGSQ